LCFSLTLTCSALLASAEPGGAYGASRFRASESHCVTTIAAGPRQGWEEHKWSITFGAFGFSVTQRLDPETGFPPTRRTWGDSFFGVRGHKERSYFAANWSPWMFLEPRIRLAGMAAPLRPPTLYGRCEFAGIREKTDGRIVAEALFRDSAGGWTRVRFSGLASCPGRFGVAVNYEPAAGKTVESVVWQLVCQPHDYSDRGYWQRERAVTTPAATTALPDKETQRFPPGAGPWLFHNRGAHLTSGVFLDRSLSNVKDIVTRGAGNTIAVELAPGHAVGWVRFVCGNWVGEHWRLRATRLFREDDAESETRAAAFSELLPTPASLMGTREIGMEGTGEISGDESPAVRAAYTRFSDAQKRQAADTAPNLAELAAAKAALKDAVDSHRAEWVTARRWCESD